MTSRPRDTRSEDWSAYMAVLDHMGGAGRLRAALELSEAVREIRMTGIRARHPGLTRQEIVARLVSEDYGVDLPLPT